jgi:ankyrin repeat protein
MKSILVSIVAALLVVGCGESQQPEWPDNSIGSAARKGNIKAIKQHLASGADVNAKDMYGLTPLDRASRKTADLLRKHGGKTKKELEAAGN